MRRLLLFVCVIAALPWAASAQQIPVKTVPVATGSQFMLFPSQNAAMGGVSIALDDPLNDPFANPARGIYATGIRFSSTPVFYDVGLGDTDASGGRTLPVGMMVSQGGLFGGAMMAWQELTQERETFCCFSGPVDFAATNLARQQQTLSNSNVYAFATAGAQWPGTNLSGGLSVFTASLNGLEGVRLLYQNGDQVDQSGRMSDIRLGLHHAWPGGAQADLVVLHHRFTMDHELPPVWVGTFDEGEFVQRSEHDQTRGWAVQATYRHPLPEGWTLGARLGGDWKTHPKIPNYDLMQIPRDPGDSQAYQIGLGLGHTEGQATFGVDVVVEPIRSHTWANALEDITTGGDDPRVIVPQGAMTVENFFDFLNAQARLGLRRTGDRFDFALGLALHAFRYHLDQTNFVGQFERELDESWSEWTGTAGLGLHFAEFDVRYTGLITWGTGRPGTRPIVPVAGALDFAGASFSNYIIAPNGPLTLQEARVVTHQVSIIVPILD